MESGHNSVSGDDFKIMEGGGGGGRMGDEHVERKWVKNC